jgi:hypothetical protein
MLLGVLAAAGYLVSRSAALNDTDILQTFSLLSVCLACSACISLPVALLTIWLRLLSFRYNLLHQLGAWESLTAAYHLFRTHLMDILILWIATLVLGFGVSMADGAIELFSNFLPYFLGAPLAFLSNWAISGVWHTIHSALWTVAFHQLTTPKRQAL